MFEQYPFILPIFYIWLPILFIYILVFYTSFGSKQKPVLNKIFLMRFASISLFIVALLNIISGITKLLALDIGLPFLFHGLVGYLFVIFGFTHIVVHFKTIIRYLFKSKKKGLYIFLAVLIAFVIVLLTVRLTTEKEKTTENTNTQGTTQEEGSEYAQEGESEYDQEEVSSYSLIEIAKHNSIDDCWLLIDGKIYDVTEYICMHPAPDRTITDYCGGESSEAYDTKEKAKSHSSYADGLLDDYYIGEMVEE